MTWAPVAPTDTPTGRQVLAPIMLNARLVYRDLMGGVMDQMTSDPRTLDIICQLIAFTEPKVLVEVGTYRGIGTAALAETLNLFGLTDSHLWSCDPQAFDVPEFITAIGLTSYVSLIQGNFEQLLTFLPAPMNFCYIDASAYDEPGLRLRYAKLALEHAAPGCVIAVDDAAADWKGAKTLRRMASLYLPQHRGLAILTK